MKLSLDDGQNYAQPKSDVRLLHDNDDGTDIQITATQEGIVFDLVDQKTGDVLNTSSQTYDEIAEKLQQFLG